MSTGAWILLVAAGTGGAAAWFTDWRLKVSRRLESPSPAEAEEDAGYARAYGRDRFVDLPGYPGPSEPDVRFAVYPPGVLGEHPESAPVPGPLSAAAGDVEDLLTGALRHVREHESRH